MKKKLLILNLLAATLAMLLLTGCGSSMMTRVSTIEKPDSGKALVTFFRPSAFGGAIKFGAWDGDKFIGILTARSYVQYQAAPGRHLFMARAENWSYVEADLQAGRQYYVVARPMMGAWKARVALDPVSSSDYNEDQINKWMKGLNPTAVIPETVEAYATPRKTQVGAAIKEFEEGRVNTMVLKPSDGV